ncbi:MAG: hypothetical protein VX627_00010 [Candidatus Thermoplasmatota archaeon]|nr:hypothetical protein [Candidatus Thermoplasmatota archaeon]
MSNDEEIEGMYTLVGDPENPELSEANEDKRSLTDRISKMVGLQQQEYEATEQEREMAQRALERAREIASQITPTKVMLASVFMAALMFSVFAVGFWVIPRDAVTVEVVYSQAGPGQVVLLQVHNYGSRPIANLAVDVTFSDLEGNILNETHFTKTSLAAHTSIAGDDLELIVTGVSNWDLHVIEITLDYDNYNGALPEEVWTLTVGEYTSESHLLKPDRSWL